jgi:carboxymethylenebutenolidase
VPTLSDQTHLRDLLQAADALGTPRVGLMGFCMGGMYCFNSAGAERFQKIVSFYGMIKLPEGWRSTTHAEPLDYLHAGHADRVLAIIGGKDPYTPAADVAELKNVGVRTEIYPDAEHGFAHDASRPAHRAQDAMSAFTHAQNWLVK